MGAGHVSTFQIRSDHASGLESDDPRNSGMDFRRRRRCGAGTASLVRLDGQCHKKLFSELRAAGVAEGARAYWKAAVRRQGDSAVPRGKDAAVATVPGPARLAPLSERRG